MNQRRRGLPWSLPALQRYFVTIKRRKTKKGSWKETTAEEDKQPNRNLTMAANHLVHAVVEKRQAGVLVADEGALLDEADEYLGLGELGEELLMSPVPTFQKFYEERYFSVRVIDIHLDVDLL